MNARGVLIAAIVLAALAGGVYWSNKQEAAKPAQASSDPDKPKLVSASEDQIRRIEVKRREGETTVLERDASNRWQITAPKPVATDQDQASTVANAVAGLTWERLIEEKPANLAEFGLSSPATEVTITTKDGKTQTLQLGDATPTNTGVFAKFSGDERVFLVPTGTKSTVEKTTQDLRDKRILTFDSDKLTRVTVTRQKDAWEFGKDGRGEWQIVKPKPMRADNFAVEEVVRKVKEGRIDQNSEAELKAAKTSFAALTPIATVAFTDPSGVQTIEIRLHQKGEEKTYHARSSAVEGVYRIHEDLGSAFSAELSSFRQHKLFEFGYSEPQKITVREGDKSYTFEKQGEKWLTGGKPAAEANKVQIVIDKIREVTARDFTETGFDKPTVEMAVTWDGGKRTDRVSFQRLPTGALAKREGEPTIYILDPGPLNEVMKAASEVK
jgi:hypothetical protein